MNILKLDAYYVNDSGMDLSNAREMHDKLIDMFEDKIEDYTLVGNGKETCFQLLGDDTGAPLTSISGEFTHNGEEYSINIPPDDDPVEIKIKLDTYGKDIAEKIAVKNIETSFKAKDIKIDKIIDKDYMWIFEVSFKGMENRRYDYSKMKRAVEVFKEGGNHVFDSL